MIHTSKETDERREATGPRLKVSEEAVLPLECWCLHGAVGAASDWRSLAKKLAEHGISTRAVDLWRFLECQSVSMSDFGRQLNAQAEGEVARGQRRVLIGYSMGGRLALHALLAGGSWAAAVIISAHPGIQDLDQASSRRSNDSDWACMALTIPWSEFLMKWNAQAILGGQIRDAREEKKLLQRRREIARSFVDWSLGVQSPLWERLGEITIPTLWIAGENDPKFVDLAEAAVALSASSSLAIAPDSAHRVPWENETWLANRILEFVS
ncbi:MAG: alpha/beta fold hydrolase [Armatimonadetes bacterium]|nr:alpha/beta fold hydrolase [Akkermansiaceae bacterium]